ncbi:MAG: response regulator [bacterium]|nr:response regulator [bacterium]
MPQHRILVVEDEGIVALDIQGKLEGMGYLVPRVVSSGLDAIAAATQLKPDLVLMDIQLEGEMDGIDAATKIHADLGIPVVYLTAYSDERTLERAKAARPFGYLLKPFEERELYTTVEIAIYKHQAERERLRLEESLRQSQKMEAIGQLTAGVAHHFNLMLQGIVGNLDLAAMDAPVALRPFLDDAAYDADRAARLVRQLMLFYRQEQSDRSTIEPAKLVQEVTTMCRSIFPSSITVALDIEPELPTISGNSGQLRQCLANLCANARDAVSVSLPSVSDRKTITLRASLLPRGVDGNVLPEGRLKSAAAPLVRIDVVDEGIGMDEATRERIFEPFFTTKEGGGPAGLGLAAAYGIVRDHGGWIDCESVPGRGTTMSVFLPAGAASGEASRVAVTEASAMPSVADLRPFRGRETVLVIADGDRFRKILDLMLERNGYQVHLGRDAGDGVNLFRHEFERLDLVIIALSQPAKATSVEDLLAELLRIDARARTLVVTARPEATPRWGAASAVMLQPFNTYQLLKTVRGILDA